jgi:hypothetical protein
MCRFKRDLPLTQMQSSLGNYGFQSTLAKSLSG